MALTDEQQIGFLVDSMLFFILFKLSHYFGWCICRMKNTWEEKVAYLQGTSSDF